MNPSSVFLSEKEERAFRRMEQLAQIRRAGRNRWGDYLALVSQSLLSAAITYWAYQDSVHRGWLYAFAAVYCMSGVIVFVTKPMRRRIEALERLLETEIKRFPVQ